MPWKNQRLQKAKTIKKSKFKVLRGQQTLNKRCEGV
jgi:hypothetical protein